MKTPLVLIKSLLATTLLLGLGACAQSQKPFEEKSSWTSSFVSQVLGGQAMPDGVNNWSCRPRAGENPVVLVHGTFSSTMYSFGALGPRLANEGLCVYAMDYGAQREDDWFKGVDAVDSSAKTITQFIGLVKAATGSEKVTLVGHSQGGLIGFYSLKMLGANRDVDRFVALAPSVNGTVISKTPNRDKVEYCLACADQHPDSALIKQLKQGGITVAGVQYSVLATKNDKVVLPVESQFVREAGVKNVYVQDTYPGKNVSHSGILYDTDSLDLITQLVTGKAEKSAATTAR